jgi:NDP-sugar pyrophosphorylase family protein
VRGEANFKIEIFPMNQIKKNPVTSLGYNFIPKDMLPRGNDEYFLRNRQNNNGIKYRGLTAFEIEVLVRNRNTSDNWNNILVSNAFNPEQVHNCKFYGLVRIGKLEPYYLEFKNLRRPVGLFNSTIISCDFGDNVVIDNCNYISHYIIGNEVIIVNVNELATTDYAKFGNGSLKKGEPESLRIWLEVCNENGGRKVIPFDGMLPGDAYLWTRFRDDSKIQSRFKEFTLAKFDTQRGYYGVVGDRTVIKNCKIIKDVNIGSDAYLKGANKLKNLTINSSAEATSQIGEGCELVNGIIDYGCRIFYGVKAVRFFMASHSQLKYGARLINSYLGNNSTISCCEVLNSLIFPFHEQHHNNSFLCAALLQGQTNIAAGATIGSNHNSRSPDGEVVAGRGFWPGLCVSLKHNSKFGSFTIIAKGDYPAELNIPVPFSLVSNDVSRDTLIVMPGYWFMHNMYALARNSWKYSDRDKRTEKKQLIEYDFLAPDTVNEIISSLELFERLTGEAWKRNYNGSSGDAVVIGKKLLEKNDASLTNLEIFAPDFENSARNVRLLKIPSAYKLFKELVRYYTGALLTEFITANKIRSLEQLVGALPKPALSEWQNIGGQLMKTTDLEKSLANIKSGKLKSWDDIHQFYASYAEKYPSDKLSHALAAAKKVSGFSIGKSGSEALRQLLLDSVKTREWMVDNIFTSREKDYSNPFRMMVYENQQEMNKVIGSLSDNPFILQEQASLYGFKKNVGRILKSFGIAGKYVAKS